MRRAKHCVQELGEGMDLEMMSMPRPWGRGLKVIDTRRTYGSRKITFIFFSYFKLHHFRSITTLMNSTNDACLQEPHDSVFFLSGVAPSVKDHLAIGTHRPASLASPCYKIQKMPLIDRLFARLCAKGAMPSYSGNSHPR